MSEIFLNGNAKGWAALFFVENLFLFCFFGFRYLLNHSSIRKKPKYYCSAKCPGSQTVHNERIHTPTYGPYTPMDIAPGEMLNNNQEKS